MIIPESFRSAFDAEMATIIELQRFAEPRLRTLCTDRHWLFDHRIKDPKSTLQKMELGRTERLTEMLDLYATMVVVPTARELDGAIEAILEIFDGQLKQRPAKPPDTFPYDDLHIHARLGGKVSPAAMPEAVRQRTFEIQVRTGLQYAWWRATHDVAYKGEPGDWAVLRLAGQTRAALELLDGLLADVRKSAELQLAADKDERPELPATLGWLALWREDLRPSDSGRYCEAVEAAMSAASVEAGRVHALLADDDHVQLRNSDQITPTQAVFVVVDEIAGVGWTEALARDGRRLLVTTEMIAARGELREVPLNHRVVL